MYLFLLNAVEILWLNYCLNCIAVMNLCPAGLNMEKYIKNISHFNHFGLGRINLSFIRIF